MGDAGLIPSNFPFKRLLFQLKTNERPIGRATCSEIDRFASIP